MKDLPRIGAPLGSRNAAKGSENRVRFSARLPQYTIDKLKLLTRDGFAKSQADVIVRLVDET